MTDECRVSEEKVNFCASCSPFAACLNDLQII